MIAYICVDILKICQPVLAVLRILDVVFSHQLIASCREEDAIHEICDCSCIVLLVPLIPQGSDIVRGITRTKNISL